MDFIQTTLFGKTCPEHSVAIAGETFPPSLKNCVDFATQEPELQCPLKSGERQITFAMEDGQSPTVYSMHSFGECPSVAVESRLSWILEGTPHPKYFLSAKACEGILRRAEKRGKKLPEMLREVLERQSCLHLATLEKQDRVIARTR